MKHLLVGPGRRRRPLLRVALAAVLAAELAACGSIDVTSIQRAGVAEAPVADQALALGRIRFVVDGRELQTHLLNKPALELYHRGQARLLITPEVDAEGHFRWRLPAGDYGVAVIRGGMSPTDQPHLRPDGGLQFVHGIVDPGLAFALPPGATVDLGTLWVEVESQPMKDVWFGKERVFGRLLGVRVEPGPSAAAGAQAAVALQAPMQRLNPAGPRGRPPVAAGSVPTLDPRLLQPLIR